MASPGASFQYDDSASQGLRRRTAEEEIHDYILQLDQLRDHCERTGDFVKAQECINRMRDVNLRHAKRIEVLSHQANVDAKSRLAEEHRLELLTFSRMWEEKLAEFGHHAQSVLNEVKMRHVQDYTQQEGILKVQLMNRRPHFSRAVIELRNQLERTIAQRKYLEAEEIKKKLAQQEQMELASFDDSLAVTFEKKTVALKSQYINELRAVEQKVKVGREELLTQRKIDFERLLARHSNIIKDLDQETKLHIAKTQQYVLRQVKAMVHDPVKTGLDLRGVSKTVRDGQGRKTSYVGAARSRTPPASARGPSAVRGSQRGAIQATGGVGASPTPSVTSRSMAWDDNRFGW